MASHYNEKKHAFLCVFYVQPKHPNGNIFVKIEGFWPCLSKPSDRASKWALIVRLMQKERLKSPQKSLFIESQAIWVILAILAILPQMAILVNYLASQFRTKVDTPEKKASLGVLLASTRPSYIFI